MSLSEAPGNQLKGSIIKCAKFRVGPQDPMERAVLDTTTPNSGRVRWERENDVPAMTEPPNRLYTFAAFPTQELAEYFKKILKLASEYKNDPRAFWVRRRRNHPGTDQ